VVSNLPVIIFLLKNPKKSGTFCCFTFIVDSGPDSENIYEELQMMGTVQNIVCVYRNTGLSTLFLSSLIPVHWHFDTYLKFTTISFAVASNNRHYCV
jgi:hypothetical protein